VKRRSMNNTVQSHQATKAHAQTKQIVQSLPTATARTQTKQALQLPQPLKQTQTTAQNPVPRSTAAISESALELSAGYGFHEIRSFFREIFSFR
jgi:cell envelope opacity-associated protein A